MFFISSSALIKLIVRTNQFVQTQQFLLAGSISCPLRMREVVNKVEMEAVVEVVNAEANWLWTIGAAENLIVFLV